MAEAAVFQPHRFRTAARHYLAGRPAYAPRLIRLVAELLRLSERDRLLDLGCGPGVLAGAFAPLVGEVVAIDPEPEMLRDRGSDVWRRGEHPVCAGKFVRPVAGAWAVSAGDDGAVVPLDGPCRDPATAGWHDRTGRRGGVVQ